MNAASLQSSASLPAVAAAPVVLWTSGGGATPAAATAGAVTPAAGQGFQPTAAGAHAAQAPAASGATAQPAGTAANGAPAAAPQAIPADKGLAAFMQMFGDSFGEPIVAPDGTVYAPAKGVSKTGGKLSVQYIKVGTIDKTTGNITFTPDVLAKIQAASQKSERKLVKVDDQYVYETFVTGDDGTKQVSKVEPATDDELKAEQAKQQQAQATQAAKDKAANNDDWSQKLGQVGQVAGLFGTVGQFTQSLAQGHDAYSGRAGASWLSAYMVANRLNSQSGGKLLPNWFTSGPVSIALDTLVTGYSMLTTGSDLHAVGVALGMAKPTGLALPADQIVKDLMAKGASAGDASMMAELGTGLRTGQRYQMSGQPLPPDGITKSLVTGSESAINLGRGVDQATGKLSELGTSRIPTDVVNKSFNAADPEGAYLTTKMRNGLDGGVNSGLGALGKLVGPAMMVTTGISAITGVMNVKSIAQKYGVSTLFNESAGRQALGGALSSTLYLAMQILPKVLTVASPAMAGIMGGLNIITNVISGVTFLDRYGLFGDKGFLNSDAIRAAFLIPPLTPIGGLAFMMKHRKDKRDAEAKQLEAAKQLQVTQLQQQLKLAQLQLQQSGTIPGATKNQDGSITFSTGVPVDPSQLVSAASTAAPPPAAGAS